MRPPRRSCPRREITFDNVGAVLHQAIAFPLNKGAALADAKKAFAWDKPPSGPPPVDFEAGAEQLVLRRGLRAQALGDLDRAVGDLREAHNRDGVVI